MLQETLPHAEENDSSGEEIPGPLTIRVYEAQLMGTAPYSQSKHHTTDWLERELPLNYEKRTWRERLHVDSNGEVFIPPTALKNCLSEAAKFLSKQIPGKGKATYTKHFEAGIVVSDPIPIGIKASEVEPESLFLPVSGRRGDGKRVDRYYPLIKPGWKATVRILVLDQMITPDVLQEHLVLAGHLIGIGRFRPRNNGYYGRFKLLAFCEVTL